MLLKPLTAGLLLTALILVLPGTIAAQLKSEALTLTVISKVDLNDSTITLRRETRREFTYKVDGDTKINVAGREAALVDVKPGSMAMVQVSARRLLAIYT
jgi:hypothetical protein